MDFTMDFGPYFTASVLLRWLGFPLLTAAAGFLVYWRMIRGEKLDRRMRRISVAVLSLALAVAVMIFCILPMWLEAWGLHSPPLSVGAAAFAAADFGRGRGSSLPGEAAELAAALPGAAAVSRAAPGGAVDSQWAAAPLLRQLPFLRKLGVYQNIGRHTRQIMVQWTQPPKGGYRI